MSYYNEDKLFEHQKQAYTRYQESSEVALFFEQGLGKSATILTIAYGQYVEKKINAILIIAPNNVHKQWAREQIPMWLPTGIYAIAVRGGRQSKKLPPLSRLPENKLQIVCVNIDTFSTKDKWQEIAVWANSHKTYIILDEATVIKNYKAQRTQHVLYAFNEVQRRGRIITKSTPKSVSRAILTGTPTTNSPFDLWAMFEFLRPGYFGCNFWAFQNRYGLFHSLDISGRTIKIPIDETIWNVVKSAPSYSYAAVSTGVNEETFNYIKSHDTYEGPYKRLDELRERIKPLSTFKKLTDCVDMPERNYDRQLLDMSEDQAKAYYSMSKQLIAEYGNKYTSASSKISAYIRLQQIASGFILGKELQPPAEEGTDEGIDALPAEVTWIGKSNPKLDALLYDATHSDGPVIILTHFTAEASRIFDELQSLGVKCSLQTGWKHVGSTEDFKAGKFDALVANTRCISRGFNFQISHRELFYSNTFSLEDRLQVESRIFRIGQKEKCLYTDYIMNDTIDMKTVAALKQHKKLLDYMRDTNVTDMLTKQDDVFKSEYSNVVW